MQRFLNIILGTALVLLVLNWVPAPVSGQPTGGGGSSSVSIIGSALTYLSDMAADIALMEADIDNLANNIATDAGEDDPVTDLKDGPQVLSVRRDTPITSAGTANDYATFNTNADGGLWTSPIPATVGGLSIHRSIDLDEGTGEVVKASPGQLYGGWVTNTATSTRWIKFYNATSCTMGTGTPVITIGIPGNSSDDIAGSLGTSGYGIAFSTGICVGATTGVADADTGAPGANDVIVNFFYK